jgi:LmbE family N-acetylglucosaminyl deacetylase
MSKRVLVVAAHPDDEVLGCGATMPLYALKGDEVHILILGEGMMSRLPARKQKLKNSNALKRLQNDARRAAGVLGVHPPEFRRFPDNRFDTVGRLDLTKAIEEVLDRLHPAVVYTHHPGDLNIDHRLTFEAVLAAVRPVTKRPVSELLAFYVPSASEWGFGSFGTFQPNVFYDVSTTIERKVRALACYGGEVRRFPHPRSPEVLRAWAKVWGASAGFLAAEGFQLIRSFRPGVRTAEAP